MSTAKTDNVEKLAARLVSYYERRQCMLRVAWHLKGDTPPNWLEFALPGILSQQWCFNMVPTGEFLDVFGTLVPETEEVSADMDIWGIIQFKNARAERLVAIPKYSEGGFELIVRRDGTADAPKPVIWKRNAKEASILFFEDRRSVGSTWYALWFWNKQDFDDVAKFSDAQLALVLQEAVPAWWQRRRHVAFRTPVIYGGKLSEDKDVVASVLQEMFPRLRVVEMSIPIDSSA